MNTVCQLGFDEGRKGTALITSGIAQSATTTANATRPKCLRRQDNGYFKQ